jgi:hypothetical protein
MVGQLTIELANAHQAEFLRRAEARRGVSSLQRRWRRKRSRVRRRRPSQLAEVALP